MHQCYGIENISFRKIRITVRASVVDPHHFDVDPDSTYHPDADADPDSDFYLMRMWMRIRIRLFTLMRIRIRFQILASK